MIKCDLMQQSPVLRRKGGIREMPLDLSSYLLSASPPAFELHYSLRGNFANNSFSGDSSSRNAVKAEKTVRASSLPACGNGAKVENDTKATPSKTETKRSGTPTRKGHASRTATPPRNDSAPRTEAHPRPDSSPKSEHRSRRKHGNSKKSKCKATTHNQPRVVYRSLSCSKEEEEKSQGRQSRYEEYEQLDKFGNRSPKSAHTKNHHRSADHARKKRVTFADERGRSLYYVRLFHESSDTPPQLSPGILARLTENEQPATVTNIPPLICRFDQPASNYVRFYDKLNKHMVSLENVVLADYVVRGTVKVKNIAFEKLVKVRYTVNSWDTFDDREAEFMSNSVGSYGNFDTFSFAVSIPPTYNINKSVEFCICFKSNGVEYWDNNDGRNYCIGSADWQSESDPDYTIFNTEEFDARWSEFSIWHHTNNAIPYY